MPRYSSIIAPSRGFTPAILALIIVLAIAGFTRAENRLDKVMMPISQDITLSLDPREDTYTGSVTVNLTASEPVYSFRFHAEELDLEEVTLSGANGAVDITWQSAPFNQILVRPTEAPLPAGDYVLTVAFSNDFNTDAVALYKMTDRGEPYLFTQMEADEAREAFPCWDEPIFKIPYTLTLTVPADLVAIANTPVESETVDGDSKTIRYATTPPLPSYLLAIAVGDFELVEVPGMPIPTRIVTPHGKADRTGEAVASTPPLLAALEEYFGRPYPYKKLDLIAVPEFWPGAMENAGAITYSEAILLLDPDATSVAFKRRLAIVTAHELAHQWFGNLVTMEWWDDLWLNESFATWMGNKIAHQVYPEYGIDVSAVSSMQGPLTSDARPSASAIRQKVESTEKLLQNLGAVYYKGQVVLNMFEEWLGEETFRQGVLDYIAANEWGNAQADDLWLALSEAAGKPVEEAMGTFIDQPGAPLVEFELTDDNSLRIAQRRLTNVGFDVGDFSPWQIPIKIKYATGGGAQSKTVLLTDTAAVVDLPGDGPVQWVFPHADATGYYRWTLPSEHLVAVSQNAVEYLTPRERIGFLGNLSALLDAGAVEGDAYMSVLHSFRNDPHPQVISSLVGNIQKVNAAFVTDEWRDEYAAYLRATLRPALNRIGALPQPGEPELAETVRPTLIGQLADEGRDQEVLAIADSLFGVYRESPDKVPASLVGTVVALGCMEGDRPLFDTCRTRFEQAESNSERARYLVAMASFRDPELQKIALEYALSDAVRPQELFYIPSIIANVSAEHADMVFEWFTQSYDRIVERIPPMFKAFLPGFAGGCSMARLETARLFFAEPDHQAPGLDEQLEKVSDQVVDCVSLREREGERAQAYLAEFAGSN